MSKENEKNSLEDGGGMEKSKDSPHMVLTAESRGQQLVVQSGA